MCLGMANGGKSLTAKEAIENLQKAGDELTKNMIVKALECCSKSGWLNDCDGCPCYDEKEDIQTSECQERIMKNALDLINRQQAEIEKLNVELVGMRGACNSYKMHYDNAKAEIERFKKIETTVNEFWCVLQKFTREKLKEKPTLEELLEYIEHARAEAIKEFIEEFTSRLEDYKYHDYTHGYFFYKDSIDHLVNYLKKEMVGEENDT